VAFLFSAWTLELGLDQMGVRYFGATLVGYGTFLVLLRTWIAYTRNARQLDFDVPDISPARGSSNGGSTLFGGGRSGGAGSSGHWSESSLGHGGRFDVDFDELWPLVLAFICALGGIIAILYVVYAAPVLLAEVALDAALVTGLYRRLRREDARHWLDSAVRRTWVPALAAGLFMMVAGIAIQWALPAADSIGDVWHIVSRR